MIAPGPSDPLPPGGARQTVSVHVRLPYVRPYLIYALLAANILVFIAQAGLRAWLGFDLLLALGAKVNAQIAAGQFWRLITPMFLHVNLVHLFFNSYALYVLGPQVEGPFGHLEFLAIYLLSGAAGVLMSFVLSPAPSVGASSAIFGLIGALMVYLLRHRRAFGLAGRQRLVNIFVITVINLGIGLQPGIDNWAHMGGLLGGAAATWAAGPSFALEFDPLLGMPRVVDRVPPLRRWLWLALAGLALAAAAGLALWSGGAQ